MKNFDIFALVSPSSLKYLGIFFLIAAAQGIFFAFSQLSAKDKLNSSRIFLSLIIFCFSLSLIESGLWWSDKMDEFVHFIMVSDPLPFLYGPLVYFYFKSNFSRSEFSRKDLFHLLPFLLYFVYCSQFYFNSEAAKMAMMNNEVPFREFFALYIKSTYVVFLMSVSLCVYALLTWREFYRKALALKEIRTWFRLAFCIFAFYILNFITFHILIRYRLMNGCADYGIATSISIFIYLFSWFGFVRPRVFDGYLLTEALRTVSAEKYRSSGLSESLENELQEKLRQLMLSEKLYRSENLNLDTLAGRLGVTRNNVSQVINRSGMNFFEYVNHWRIEEAKKLLSETSKKDLNIIEVAYEVGFNNKVSFNKFFKKSTGLTPSEFRKTSEQK